MNLYVWSDPYPVKYGSSLLIAVAPTLEDARAVACRARGWSYGGCENRTQDWYDIVRKLGPPLRVVPVPCAEFHEWSE